MIMWVFGRGRGQGAGDDGPGVDAAGPVRGGAAGAAAQEPLDRRGRDGGEQGDAVDAVIAQYLGLARPDAVQGFDGQRGEPFDGPAGLDGEDAAGVVDPGGGGGRDGDRGPDPDAHVDSQARE
ncbi:hypothetical protein ADL00_11615, partial [Streptomyces sp. AS58]